ncbi:MAG: hypothetical protein MJ176_06800 [Treponema sp.]|nr:hypothetical protein [Treponema sp.]
MLYDSYADFFNSFNIAEKDFIEWNLKKILFPIEFNEKGVRKEWEDIKAIARGNFVEKKTLYIRAAGRNSNLSESSKNYIELINYLFSEKFSVETDPDNNKIPQDVINKTTGFIRYQDSKKMDLNDDVIANYQLSHLFENRTKNPLLFSAPWMTCYTPKIFDPFTGHESQLHNDCYYKFLDKVFEVNCVYIDEYNDLLSELCIQEKLEEWIQNNKHRFGRTFKEREILYEFSPIDKQTEINLYLNNHKIPDLPPEIDFFSVPDSTIPLKEFTPLEAKIALEENRTSSK